MADTYDVGSSQKKDRYMVGGNGKDRYYIGGGGKSPGQADNKKLGSGDQDPVVGSKSAFNYPDDGPKTYKDIGDRADNMNFGGSLENGIRSDGVTHDGGQLQLVYSAKGDWDAKKDAMARRAGMAFSNKEVGNRSSQYNSPVVDSYPMKK